MAGSVSNDGIVNLHHDLWRSNFLHLSFAKELGLKHQKYVIFSCEKHNKFYEIDWDKIWYRHS